MIVYNYAILISHLLTYFIPTYCKLLAENREFSYLLHLMFALSVTSLEFLQCCLMMRYLH